MPPPPPPGRKRKEGTIHVRSGPLALVVVLLASSAAASALDGAERACLSRYSDYFTSLTADEVKVVCRVMDSVKVDDGGGGGGWSPSPSPPSAEEIRYPTRQEMNYLIHVEDGWDEQRKKAELRKTEMHEEFIRQRDRDNLAMRELFDLRYGGGQGPVGGYLSGPPVSRQRQPSSSYYEEYDINMEHKFH